MDFNKEGLNHIIIPFFRNNTFEFIRKLHFHSLLAYPNLKIWHHKNFIIYNLRLFQVKHFF